MSMSSQDGNMGKTIPQTDQERRHQPLANAVKTALVLYFQQLDGQEPEKMYRMVLEEIERPLLETVMRRTGGNQTMAARWLGLNRGTLRTKLKQYDLG